MKSHSVVLIDDDQDVLDLFSIFLESYLNIDLFTFTQIDEAKKFLNAERDNVKLVISDYKLGNDTYGTDIIDFIKQKNIESYVILLSGYDIDVIDKDSKYRSLEYVSYLNKPLDLNNFKNTISGMIGSTPKCFKSEYLEMPLTIISKYDVSDVNIFIKLSDEKFVKIISNSAVDSADIIEKYKSRGIHSFFLSINDYKQFIELAINEITEKIASGSANGNDRIELHFTSVDKIHESLHYIGITDESINLASTAMSDIVSLSKDNKNLSFALKKIMDKKNYIYKLAMLSSYISVAIAEEMEGDLGRNAIEKLAFAGMFQDVALSDESLAKVNAVNSGPYSRLSDKQQTVVLSHPLNSANTVEDIDHMMFDVGKIIMMHHERPDHTGFPAKKGSKNIPPLACVFIIAREFSHMLITEGFDDKVLKKSYEYIMNNFNLGNFLGATNAFSSVFKKLDSL